MAAKPGFLDYLSAAFNARPMGMFVAPNWVGIAAFGILGAANPGFWVIGAGLELGYLLSLATNKRARNGTSASSACSAGSMPTIAASTTRWRSAAARSSTCR